VKLFVKALSATLLFSLSVSAHALYDAAAPEQSAAPQITPTKPGLHLVLNGGLTYGGDTIATARYTDGSTTDIKGGALIQFGIGGLYQFEDNPVALMLSANYHVHSAFGKNGDISFSRMPIEALAYYTGKKRFRIGGGVRIVNSPEFTSTVSSPISPIKSATFDNATGIVAEIGYQLSPQGWLNFRFVSEKYQGKLLTAWNGATASLAGSAPVSGSHLGVNFSYEF